MIMIFKSITELSNNTEKKFFKEKIAIYIRLVEVFCEKNSLVFETDDTNVNIKELKDIGIIKDEKDLKNLEKFLGEIYPKFVSAVNFAVNHKNDLDHLLDKLSNKKRQAIQKKSALNNKYTLVDLFCGAGGLSLGFLQQGFNIKLANDIEDVCIETYKYNHPEIPSNKVIQGDIKKL